MAVEKMSMVQIVGRLDRLNAIVKTLFDHAAIELVDAMTEIDNYSFTINTQEHNLQRTLDFNHVTSFEKETRFHDQLLRWKEIFGEKEDRSEGKSLLPMEEAEELFHFFDEKHRAMEEIKARLASLHSQEESLHLFSAQEIELSDLADMKEFSCSYGTLTEIGRRTIKGNYENIPAAILHLGSMEGEEAYLMIYPAKLEEEIQRVRDSLNWKPLPLPEHSGSNAQSEAARREEVRTLHHRLEAEEAAFRKAKEEQQDRLQRLYRTLLAGEAIEEAKQYLAHGNTYFYLAGWVPQQQVAELQQRLSSESDLLFKTLEDDETALTPPTRLKNHSLVRPFEALIHMYGTPNYREMDPTAFFGVTYLLLFGAMFGDLGQGAVFALAGWYLLRHRHPNLGGVILRIGLSSMVFGLLYGSVFGNETLLPALLIKPFENINTVLLVAIAFGVVLSSASYCLGIVNKLRMGDLEEGLFGKEGVVGFVLYLSMIGAVLSGLGLLPLPVALFGGLIVLCLVLLLVKQPLTNALLHKKQLYEEEAGSYYVESGFSLLEALISIFSGTVSFIRVGAFAINHVGLFLAFETMGEMMGGTGHWAMLVIGNLVIIGLEGLIVFIQSLRLEYYEMFSKYYVGDGRPFTETKRGM